jgi:hypothetical protein
MLRASELYQQPFQLKIGREQWKTEVSHWFSVGLAQIQLTLLRLVLNSPTLDKKNLPNQLNTKKSHDIACRIVKFNSAGYLSLGTFGLFFVVIISGLIIVFGLFELQLRRLLIMSLLQRTDSDGNEYGGHNPPRWLVGREGEGIEFGAFPHADGNPQPSGASSRSVSVQHDGTDEPAITRGVRQNPETEIFFGVGVAGSGQV